MKNMNWTEAVKRIYLLAWAIWTLIMVFAAFSEGLATAEKFGFWALAMAAPAGIYFGAKWVYSGLQSKQDTYGA